MNKILCSYKYLFLQLKNMFKSFLIENNNFVGISGRQLNTAQSSHVAAASWSSLWSLHSTDASSIPARDGLSIEFSCLRFIKISNYVNCSNKIFITITRLTIISAKGTQSYIQENTLAHVQRQRNIYLNPSNIFLVPIFQNWT